MFEEIKAIVAENLGADKASITPETCLLYTSPSPRDRG